MPARIYPRHMISSPTILKKKNTSHTTKIQYCPAFRGSKCMKEGEVLNGSLNRFCEIHSADIMINPVSTRINKVPPKAQAQSLEFNFFNHSLFIIDLGFLVASSFPAFKMANKKIGINIKSPLVMNQDNAGCMPQPLSTGIT